ncbi:MAG: ABC transporter ATP-binding protein/permease [Clostridiales bacterium]|nr:ABC transporter ATP-binding protein/permease [Clostridiales bacterium]
MKKIFVYLKPYRLRLLLGMLLMAISTVCELLLPNIMSDILNTGVYNADLPYIFRCCAKMLLVALVSLGSVLGGWYISSGVVAGFCADLRLGVFRKVNTMRFEDISRMGSSALLTRSTHDVGTLSWVASMLSGSIITIPVLFIGGVVLALGKDAVLSLVLLLFIPLVFAVVVNVGKKIEPLWETSDKYMDKQNDIVRERLHGIRVIRAFNSEAREHKRIEDATQVMAENIIRANVSMGVISPLTIALMNMAVVLIVYLGGFRMERGISSASGGDIFAVIQYITLIMNGVVMAAFSIVMYPHAKVAAKRIGEVLEVESPAEPEEEALQFSGDIRLENLSFGYEGAAENAVSNINLHIEPGQQAAIIGGTGSGKSTLVQLLMGFRRPSDGHIYFDGRDSMSISPKTIRANISCVLQKAAIYSGTIRKNIAMGKPGATEEELLAAAEIAQMGEYLASLPDGLDHELTQAGKNLSGGQKQRVCIARAVLKNAPIYIFDDSFSALDFLTEARLRRALSERTAGKTRIVITQRVSSAMSCDCIFVMDKGRLVDAGSHQELLERCKIYQEIYVSQTGGERR